MAHTPYMFARHVIDPRQVFCATPLSYSFVNIRPAVPGHVLIIPRRIVQRFRDLTQDEVTDLMVTSQRVARVLESLHQVSSLTITIQDGPEAGQTVPHVHVHVLPRRPGDFHRNDDVYDAIDNSAVRTPSRTIDDMSAEADKLRALLDC